MANFTSCPDQYKRCTMCQQCIPATPQYFLRNKLGLYGLQAYCKECSAALRHGCLCKIDPYKASQKKPCAKCREIKSAEGFYPAKRGLLGRRTICIACEKELQHSNLPRIRVKQRIRYHNNPQVGKSIKDWQIANFQKVKSFKQSWKKNNPEQVQVASLRRRARIYSLPDTFTHKEYQQMMEYWGYACAITGQTADLHVDHWIPVAHEDCPGTVAINLIPLAAHLNLNKHRKPPHQWLYETFPEDQARIILERIEAYFEWVRSQAD